MKKLEPTNDMHIAFRHNCGPADTFESAYRAMIAAAPKQEK